VIVGAPALDAAAGDDHARVIATHAERDRAFERMPKKKQRAE
jgi:hypothetical protein